MKQTLLDKAKAVKHKGHRTRVWTDEELDVWLSYFSREITARQAYNVLFNPAKIGHMAGLYMAAHTAIKQGIDKGRIIVK